MIYRDSIKEDYEIQESRLRKRKKTTHSAPLQKGKSHYQFPFLNEIRGFVEPQVKIGHS